MLLTAMIEQVDQLTQKVARYMLHNALLFLEDIKKKLCSINGPSLFTKRQNRFRATLWSTWSNVRASS